MFLAPLFALAGVIAAAGVLVIHLLNRHRFKVVDWAAMDFLREAIFRNRRIMRLRDLLLLALRMACLILFGMALARPYLGKTAQRVDPNQPVHAVLLVDNSMSMGYEELDGTLLDDAKTRAKALIDKLPRGSRISVLPTCDSPAGFSYEAYYGKEDAAEALGRIEPVDRAMLADQTIDLALEACRRVPDMAAKQIYLFTDRQVADWPVESLAEHLKQLPGPIEAIEVEPAETENAWVSDFKLRDGVADLQTPSVFVAAIEYEGELPRHGVPVTLTVEGVTIETKTIDLQPGQRRQIEFTPYEFDVAAEPGRPTFVTAEVSIPQDRLPADDQRFLVVPVVARLPVVFVDQWGQQQEDPQKNRYGETFHLRRLLAPLANRAERRRQLVEVRHVTIDQLGGAAGRDVLEDARLVVIAGVAGPETSVPLLREYVEQGGNLVIAAGGHFDPALWTEAAWKDGLGILPAPIEPVTVGRLPDESGGPLEPFQLDYNSLRSHDYFLLEGVSSEEQADLYRLPYFFKAVNVNVGDEVKKTMAAAAANEIAQRRRDRAQVDRLLAELEAKQRRKKLTAEERNRLTDLQLQREKLKPSWLLWQPPEPANDQKDRSAEELAERTRFTVLARYTNGLPFMVERRIGRGRVLLVSTGVYSEWNTLALTNAMLVYDRILRGMLEDTLPNRNLGCERRLVLPVAAAERTADFTLTRPDGREESLAVDAMGADRWGVTLGDLFRRGHYQVTAARTNHSSRRATPAGEGSEGLESKLWVLTLAINGPAEESQLVSTAEVRRRRDRGRSESLQTAQAFSVGGLQRKQLRAAGLWRWLMFAALGCLLVEMTVLAWPSVKRDESA